MRSGWPVEGRIWAFFSQPAFLAVNGTVAFVGSGRVKKDAEVENMCSISEREMPWLVRPKKPSVSAACTNCTVISSILDSKSWRDILGMVRSAYFVGAIVIDRDGFWGWRRWRYVLGLGAGRDCSRLADGEVIGSLVVMVECSIRVFKQMSAQRR